MVGQPMVKGIPSIGEALSRSQVRTKKEQF